MKALEVKNISKSFSGTPVIKDISFSLDKGEILSIIGSSGSGKTTLLRCLNFLEKPDSGVVIVNGEEIYNSEFSEKYKKIPRTSQLKFGMVFQSFNLFPHLSVKKNITLSAELDLKSKKLPKANKVKELQLISEKADALLNKVGLSDKADVYPSSLSGGQQQRVAIARALMLSPEILCFDEPTSALDPELTGEVLRVIKSLKSSDTTMIIVTHEMEFAKSVSDKIIYMADGIIEEEGTPDEVFNNTTSERTKAFLNMEKNYF